MKKTVNGWAAVSPNTKIKDNDLWDYLGQPCICKTKKKAKGRYSSLLKIVPCTITYEAPKCQKKS